MNRLRPPFLLLPLLLTLTVHPAYAQTDTQLWANLTLNWVKGDRLVYELDLEPKALVDAPKGEPDWRNLDVTPNVEFSPNGWADFVGEVATGYTKQTDDSELVGGVAEGRPARPLPVPRPAYRAYRGSERPPARRIVFRDLVRVESRNMFYTGAGSGSDSTIRFRNRVEVLVPLNKPKISDDGARYVLADWEWYIPLGDVEERFANKQRVRAGLGYRRDAAWRFEALYIWTRSRNTIEDGFTTSEHIIDIRVKRVF